MKKVTLFFASAFLILFSCNQKDNRSSQALDITDFEERLNNTSGKILLDVRTLPEYRQGPLENSVLMDIYREDFTEQVNKLDKSKPVFIYCASGIRSEKAATILIDQGFNEVYHMEGGVEEWVTANKPITKD